MLRPLLLVAASSARGTWPTSSAWRPVDSLAAARAAIDSDPAVKAGRFTVELRAWLAGDQIRTAQSPPPAAGATKPSGAR